MRHKEGEHRKRERGKRHRENITGHNGERPEKEKGRKKGWRELPGLRIKIGVGGWGGGRHILSTQNQENGSKVSQ